MPNDERVYDPVGFFLLRTPALPVETIASITGADTADTAVDDADRRSRTRERLRALARRPDVHRALTVASADLVAALTRLDDDPDATAKKTRRAYSRLLRYLTRMATRPTPFGCFSSRGWPSASSASRRLHGWLGRRSGTVGCAPTWGGCSP